MRHLKLVTFDCKTHGAEPDKDPASPADAI